MNTKLGKLLSYCQRPPPLKLCDPLITCKRDVTRQFEKFVFPFLQNFRLLNLGANLREKV